MKTQANGRIIILEEGDDKSKILETTMCKCGHPLYLHSWIEWVSGTIHTSQCTSCGFAGEKKDRFSCPQFEAK